MIQESAANPLALVLGGGGAVGSHLCDALISQSCRGICVDKFDSLRKNNVTHLEGNRNFTMVDKVERQEAVNYVFCLADQWHDYLEQFSDSRWLFFGSKFNEPLFNRAQEQGINSRFVCVDSFFGPRMDLGAPLWLAKLIGDIFFRRRVQLAGDGSELIYPLFVKDVVTGLTAALFMPQSQGQVFYFAGQEITLFSFTKLWSDHLNDLKIDFDDRKTPPGANYQRESVFSQKELGWKVNFNHREAVALTIDWLNRPDVFRLLSGNLAANQTPSFILNSKINQDKAKPSPKRSEGSPTRLAKSSSKLPVSDQPPTAEPGFEPEKEGLWLSRESNLGPGSFLWSAPDADEDKDGPLSPEKKEVSKSSEKKNNRSWPRGRSSYSKIRLWGLVGLLLVAISPFFFLAKDLFLGVGHLDHSQEDCLSGSLTECQRRAVLAQKYFYQAREETEKLDPILVFFLGQRSFSKIEKSLSLAQEIADALEYFSISSQKLATVFQAVVRNQEVDFADLISTSQRLMERAYFKLTNVTATANNLSSPLADKISNQLPKITEGTRTALDSLPLLADFLAKDNQRIILLLQNNMELRPTGGFIGSLGLLSFEAGRLVDFSIKDVYEADGQLKGQVEPPEDLKTYLGEESWYLRDANWSPDFPKTAEQILWFWEKQLDQEAEGVIAINLEVVKKFLTALGEVYLPDYQETITAQNLFERAEYYSEVGFFPGSTQKKDFLGSLAFEILETLRTKDDLSSSLLAAAEESLSRGEALIYFADNSLESQIMTLGFDGGIKEAICQEDGCLSDYLWSVDTNVGANKANFFLEKRLVQRLGLSGDQVSHSLRLTWRNTAQTDSWPAGAYKNFWRLYLPGQAIVQEAFLEDDADQREAISLNVGQEMGKQVLSYLVEVPINSQVTLEVNYRLSGQFGSSRKRLAYLVQKQAGTDWDEDVTLVSYPTDWLPLTVSPQGDVSEGAITYRNILDRQRLFEFEWGEP